MEMIEPTMLLVLALVAFVAGFIDAVAGGGGMLTVPALLSLGLPPHIALGTNKLAATFASSTAAFTYYKKRLFKPQCWGRAFAATLVGATLGTLFVDAISTDWLEKVLPLIILAAALYTVFHKRHIPLIKAQYQSLAQSCIKTVPARFVDWFLRWISRSRNRRVWTVSSMALYRLNILLASGLAKAMNFTSNFTSLITFAILGHINWVLGLTMGVCLMAGAFVGAHSAIRFGSKFIRPVFVTVVSVLAIKLAYDAWFVGLS